MTDAANVIDAAVVSVLSVAVVALALCLRVVSARGRRLRREAEEANRVLAAFVDRAVEDIQDGGPW